MLKLLVPADCRKAADDEDTNNRTARFSAGASDQENQASRQWGGERSLEALNSIGRANIIRRGDNSDAARPPKPLTRCGESRRTQGPAAVAKASFVGRARVEDAIPVCRVRTFGRASDDASVAAAAKLRLKNGSMIGSTTTDIRSHISGHLQRKQSTIQSVRKIGLFKQLLLVYYNFDTNTMYIYNAGVAGPSASTPAHDDARWQSGNWTFPREERSTLAIGGSGGPLERSCAYTGGLPQDSGGEAAAMDGRLREHGHVRLAPKRAARPRATRGPRHHQKDGVTIVLQTVLGVTTPSKPRRSSPERYGTSEEIVSFEDRR